MVRSLCRAALAICLPALAACGTVGEPSTLTLAELTTRCAARGGTLAATGGQTGQAAADYSCTVRAPRSINDSVRNSAIDRSLKG